jgi:hypothetical protein
MAHTSFAIVALCLLMISDTVTLTAKYHEQSNSDELPGINDVNGTSTVTVTSTTVNTTNQTNNLVQPIAVSSPTAVQPQLANTTVTSTEAKSNESIQIVYPSSTNQNITNATYLPGP